MKKARPVIFVAGAVLFALAFYAFYLKYVPLIPGFQAIFLPVGLLVLGFAAWKPRLGGLVFLGAFPLVNNWPYFFGVQQSTPHAPAAAVLVLFLFLGLTVHAGAASLRPNSVKIAYPINFIARPLRFAAAIVAVAAVITYWKWTHFYPLRADGVYDLVTNVDGIAAGGARMSTLFAALSYLGGFGLFAALGPLLRNRKERNLAAVVLGGSLLVAIVFGMIQALFDPSFGNTRFWVYLKQINATFKDPNAFGAVIAGLGPFFLGAAIYFQKARRALFGGAFALIICVFPFIGVRSALLGLGAAVAALIALLIFDSRRRTEAPASRGEGGPARRKSPSKRAAGWAAAAVLGLFAVALLSGVFSGSRLFQRITASFRGVAGKGGVVSLSPERYFLWKEAVRMAGDYPLTGVGLGAFLIEISNSYARDKTAYEAGFEGWRRNDSAENYFLQAAAELGLPGLAAVGALVWAIGREVGRGFRRRASLGRDRFLLYGASAGLLSFALNMLFHSYLASFETQFSFWILAAFVAAIGRSGEGNGGHDEREARLPGKRIANGIFILALILYAGATLWAQYRSLSIAATTREFGLTQEFGLYPLEKADDGRPFHWTRKEAGLTVKVTGPVVCLPLFASHPDISAKPVEVEITLVKDMFRSVKTLRRVVLRESRWETIEARVSEYLGEEVIVLVKASRTWNPRRAAVSSDSRNLGVALGEISFRQ